MSWTKHSGPEFEAIAERFTILRCQIGSGVHGTNVPGAGDRDEMGICVEPARYVIGLRAFDQYVYRSQPEGVRSGVGDLDLTVYSLRKWMALALVGNPTVLIPLFAPEKEIVAITGLGRELLRDGPEFILWRQAGLRFLGYLRAQRDRMVAHPEGKGTNRPELVDKYGFDVKFAAHMVRLGLQGVELLTTGRITLPMPEPWRSWIVSLRQGGHTKEETLALATDLEARLEALVTTSDLPEHPDHARADEWLVRAYTTVWAEDQGDGSTVSSQA
ncbi:nucleotidyltransferase domain-containing protein [Spongiactinospora sp. TRM90649]|uniref:DNA polymerase beta superfamily protein n=1 Tax=Spongiactinospora sp. TRM90649 TaxID=3031114 RepID=UPI0023F78302|nr:nucleotidyltransferase domain-containing protein [Spongiactinospora sp. TRM90649]MDF5751090.1 nucleotidyltransferase domain-containing protein [Spongiactinospora sp. TRM90649]